MLHLLQSNTDTVEKFIVPDSVQKAKAAELLYKLENISNMDYKELLTNLVQEAGWIVLKVALALAFYFIGKMIIKWVLRIMDRAFVRHSVELS